MCWCMRLDAFEKLENEVGGRRMKRVSFVGLVSETRSEDFAASVRFITVCLPSLRLRGADLIRLLRFQRDSELKRRLYSMNLAFRSLPFP